MHEGDSFHLNFLEKTYFFVKLTGRAMVRPVSSGKWKAPSVSCQPFISSLYAVILVICGVNIKGQASWSAWHMAPSCV